MAVFGVAGSCWHVGGMLAAPWRLAWEARMTDETGLREPGPPSARRDRAPEAAGGAVRRVRAALGVLFPEAPEPRPVPESGPGPTDAARPAGRRAVCVAIEVAAVCAGAAVLLPRIAA